MAILLKWRCQEAWRLIALGTCISTEERRWRKRLYRCWWLDLDTPSHRSCDKVSVELSYRNGAKRITTRFRSSTSSWLSDDMFSQETERRKFCLKRRTARAMSWVSHALAAT